MCVLLEFVQPFGDKVLPREAAEIKIKGFFFFPVVQTKV